MEPVFERKSSGTEYFSLNADDQEPSGACGGAARRPPGASSPVPSGRAPARAAPGLAVHAVWLAWSLALAAAAACWGLRAGARPQLEAVWGELRRLEELQAQHAQQLATTGACVTEVRGSGGRWELLRADGRLAGAIELGPPAAGARVTAGASTDAPGGAFRISPSAFRSDFPPSPAKGAAEAQEGSRGHEIKARVELPELMCRTPQRPEWQEVKAMAAQHLGDWRAGVVPRDTSELRGLLETAVQRLQGVQGFTNECGLGRLSMSVLAVLTETAQRSLQGAPAVHAPLLAVLLDMPWGPAVWSGWPLFALLGQLHLHTRGSDDRPKEGSADAEYLRGLEEQLLLERPRALAELGEAFLKGQGRQAGGAAAGAPAPPGGEAAAAHAMPVLCALASQLLGAGLRAGDAAGAEEALRQMQDFYRQSVQSAEDLHASVVSAWPLYGVLHAAAVHLRAATEGRPGRRGT